VLHTYGLPVAPVSIADHRAFARAIASGRAVTEFEPQGKAAGEITQLWTWIRQQIDS
jgi:chromosome partitioning protein